MNENELKTENTNNDETNSSLTLPLIWHAEDKEELLSSTFNHSTETVRKDTKMDLLLTAIGVFAIICFGIMLYQCIHFNSFSLSNYICFICYAVIAILFIPKPMQSFLSKMFWNMNLGKFSAASQKASEATLHDEKAEFVTGKKTVSVSYKYMEAIFETDNYFVLMIESKRILTFAKTDLSNEQIELIREILAPYISEDDTRTAVSDETNDAKLQDDDTNIKE